MSVSHETIYRSLFIQARGVWWMLFLCVSTVLCVMPSVAATSLLVRPWANSLTISLMLTYPELGSYLRPIRLSIGWCRTWRSMITRFITQVNAAKRPKTMQPRTKR